MKEHVQHAFAAYDAMRRPRSQKIVELGSEYGDIYAFMHPEIVEDLYRIRAKMYEGEMHASRIDMDKQNQYAVDLFLQNI
jgi:salicylate hydroxylase